MCLFFPMIMHAYYNTTIPTKVYMELSYCKEHFIVDWILEVNTQFICLVINYKTVYKFNFDFHCKAKLRNPV